MFLISQEGEKSVKGKKIKRLHLQKWHSGFIDLFTCLYKLHKIGRKTANDGL